LTGSISTSSVSELIVLGVSDMTEYFLIKI
jgi:hypothetical protein